MNKNRITYWIALAVAVIVAIALELTPALDGICDKDSLTAICCLYAMIIASLGLVYLALKMIHSHPLLRIAMIIIPLLLNLVQYHVFMTPSFFYLAIIMLLAYIFVYPSKKQ